MKLFTFLVILFFANSIFAGPPILAFDVKEDEPAPISGKVLSIPEWNYCKKTETCCEKLMQQEIVRLAAEDRKGLKEPLIGDPWLFGGGILFGVAVGVIIALELGNKK